MDRMIWQVKQADVILFRCDLLILSLVGKKLLFFEEWKFFYTNRMNERVQSVCERWTIHWLVIIESVIEMDRLKLGRERGRMYSTRNDACRVSITNRWPLVPLFTCCYVDNNRWPSKPSWPFINDMMIWAPFLSHSVNSSLLDIKMFIKWYPHCL